MAAWLSSAFQWPSWASGPCLMLSTCLILLHTAEKTILSSRSTQNGCNSIPKAADIANRKAFSRFQRQYLVVYGLVMFADWLQGTHMYSLYQSYGFNVSALFLTGFLSSVIFGGLVGPLVDKHGRRNACLVYCALEIIINILEDVPNMAVLLVGRVLGGISTSLLFSAFESWMVTEHRARGFAEFQLGKTFALGSEINGIVAVVAGLVAQVAADIFGEIGPFRVAVGVTALAAAFVLTWAENYGSSLEKVGSGSPKSVHAESSQVKRESRTLVTSAYALGLCYSLFEGAMYVFVFLWYPTLQVCVPDGVLPSGLVFSSFMLCIAIGSKLFDLADAVFLCEEVFLLATTTIAAVTLIVPAVTDNYQFILTGFLVFEVCVGVISPCCATLRSKYFPKDQLSTTLSLFRIPTNVLVVLGTGGANYLTNNQLFIGCSTVLGIASGCAAKLAQTSSAPSTSTQKLKEQ